MREIRYTAHLGYKKGQISRIPDTKINNMFECKEVTKCYLFLKT